MDQHMGEVNRDRVRRPISLHRWHGPADIDWVATGSAPLRSRLPATERRRQFSLRHQLRLLAPLAALWLVGLAVLAVAQVQTAAPLQTLFLDPAHLAGAPWYTGALSNLGILVWTAGVVFAGAGAWVARRIGRSSAERFLAFGALATLVLVLDDVFAFHAGPLQAALGGSKQLAQLVIVLPAVAWTFVFIGEIRRTRSILLFAALCSLAGSVFIDVIDIGLRGDTRLLVEDGMKFLGILAWSQYFAITSRDIAASVIATAFGDKAFGDRALRHESGPRRSGDLAPSTRTAEEAQVHAAV